MPYDKQPWLNDAAGATPITAERLGHIEDGIEGAMSRAEASVASTALAELVQDILGAALVQGSNITISYDDTAGKVTISATGLSGGLQQTGNVVTLDGDTQSVGAFTVVDDSSSTSTWPNRLEFNFQTPGGVKRHTFYLNEYGEFRVVAAKPSTTASRVFTREFGTDAAHSTTVPVWDVMDDRDNRNILAAVFSDGRMELVGSIKASNLPPGGITANATAPTSPQVGQIWVDLGA